MIYKRLLNKFLSLFKRYGRYLQSLRDLPLIRSSYLFDKNWYLANNPDLARSWLSPALHYLIHGGFEGRDPGPSFRNHWYTDAYGAEEKVWMNPLIHYIRYAQDKGRIQDIRQRDLSLIRSCGLFDEAWYLENNPDVAKSGIDPALHYLLYGAFEGRDPSPNFHIHWYLEAVSTVKEGGINPFIHYLIYVWKEGHGIKPFKLARMYDYSKAMNCLVYEDVPEKIYVQRPTVIGNYSGILEEGFAVCPQSYVSILENVVVFGGANFVVTRENVILNDELVDFNTREYSRKSYRIKDVNKNSVLFEYNEKPSSYIKEGVLLSSGHDASYFHWLVECLPKLLLIDSLNEYKNVPLLIPSGLHKNLMKALECLNINNRALIIVEPDSACQVERLIFPSVLSQMNDRMTGKPVFNVDFVLSRKWVTKVGERLKSRVNYDKKPWRKIFLTRRTGRRSLENLEQLEMLLLEHGFEIVDLSRASLEFQIELFSQAALVVAPAGATLTNMLFCQPGTKIIALASNHESANHYVWSSLGAVANLEVKTIIGERLYNLKNFDSVHDDYVVNAEIVLYEVENWGSK